MTGVHAAQRDRGAFSGVLRLDGSWPSPKLRSRLGGILAPLEPSRATLADGLP